MLIKILLADDHAIVREGLRTLFDKQKDMKVVAEANNGYRAVQLAHKLIPDVVIMEISMSRMNGMEVTRRIMSKHPDIKIIVLSQHSEKRFIQNMLEAGASGYVHKTCGYTELVKAIRAAIANHRYFCPVTDIDHPENEARSSRREQKATRFPLTIRERQVLKLLAEGKKTQEIAALLKVSAKTIETHRLNIAIKLDTHSIARLTKYAIRVGITTLLD